MSLLKGVRSAAEGDLFLRWVYLGTCSQPVRGFQVHDANIQGEKKKSEFSSVRSCCCEITAGRFSEDDKEEGNGFIFWQIPSGDGGKSVCDYTYVFACVRLGRMSALI